MQQSKDVRPINHNRTGRAVGETLLTLFDHVQPLRAGRVAGGSSQLRHRRVAAARDHGAHRHRGVDDRAAGRSTQSTHGELPAGRSAADQPAADRPGLATRTTPNACETTRASASPPTVAAAPPPWGRTACCPRSRRCLVGRWPAVCGEYSILWATASNIWTTDHPTNGYRDIE